MIKTRKQNFFEYLTSNILDYLLGIFPRKLNVVIPNKIGKYEFVKILSIEDNSDTAVLMCTDENGNNVVAKIWQGRFKNVSYYGLVNEYVVYKLLSKKISSLANDMPEKFKKVNIPKIIDFIESENQTALVIEWIDGKKLESFSNKKIFTTYKVVSEFFDFISINFNASDVSKLQLHKSLIYIVTYPLYLVVSLILNIKYMKLILKSFRSYLKGIIGILNDQNLKFVHRDLNFKNILVKDEQVYVIDFQYSLMTIKAVEFVNTLRYCWDKNIIKEDILKLAQESCGLYELKALIVAHGTHGLTARNFNRGVINRIAKYIQMGDKL